MPIDFFKFLFKAQTRLGYLLMDLLSSTFFNLRSFLLSFFETIRSFARNKYRDARSFLKKKTLCLVKKLPIARLEFDLDISELFTHSKEFLTRSLSAFSNEFVEISSMLFYKFLQALKKGLYISTKFFGRVISSPFWLTRKFFRFIFNSKQGYFFFGVIFSLLFLLLPYEIYVLSQELPSTDLLVEKGNRRSTKILDRNGALLYEIYEDRKYEPVELEQIPEHVIQATLAIEDDRFYEHYGFRLDSIVRALHAIAFEGELQGASTITQQLVKNVLLTPERTLSRKTKELLLSVMVENKYSKDQILELYLNNISYGGTAWGIEAASKKFFNKHVWDLDLAEASMLAGLPSAPSAYSPLSKDIEPAKNRQKQVLDRMVALGNITSQEARAAYEKQLDYAPQEEYIRAPHFVSYIRSILDQKYGARFVTFGGLTVKTTLDLDLQDKAQQIVQEGVAENSYLNLKNGAAIILDVKTGGILAYVGSVDFFQEDWGAYDVLRADRQPGSSIKPVTYSLALSRDFTPATIIEDKPTSFPLPGQKPYKPVNYDGRYHGKVTVRQALANSYNIPAVKVAQKVTPAGIVALGKKMGLDSWNTEDTYGLSVTLGGKEVKMVEHANVFATLARGGRHRPLQPFLSIRDSNGKELLSHNTVETSVLDPGVAFLVTNILSDNNARAPAFGYNSPLNIPGKTVAVKTGTTDNKRDNWTMGYTPSYVVGVWVGNNDNSEMNRYLASGLTGAAPIWHRIMTVVLEDVPEEKFQIPENVILKKDPKCNGQEYFLKESRIPETLCFDKKEDEKRKD